MNGKLLLKTSAILSIGLFLGSGWIAQAEDRPLSSFVKEEASENLTIDDVTVVSIYPDLKESGWSQQIVGEGFHIVRGMPIFDRLFEQNSVICSHPVDENTPAIFRVRTEGNSFSLFVHGHPLGDSHIEIWAGERQLIGGEIGGDQWTKLVIPEHSGSDEIEIRHSATGWYFEFLYYSFG